MKPPVSPPAQPLLAVPALTDPPLDAIAPAPIEAPDAGAPDAAPASRRPGADAAAQAGSRAGAPSQALNAAGPDAAGPNIGRSSATGSNAAGRGATSPSVAGPNAIGPQPTSLSATASPSAAGLASAGPASDGANAGGPDTAAPRDPSGLVARADARPHGAGPTGAGPAFTAVTALQAGSARAASADPMARPADDAAPAAAGGRELPAGAVAAPGRSVTAHRLSVVVPMYNEIDNVAPLIDAIQAALAGYAWPWELIVVDDGSRDGTGAALLRHAAGVGPHIRVLRLARNFRQTAAMQAGIDAARGDVIATLDGDLQNDPRDIPRLVARLLDESLDMVAGWRRDRQDGWFLRKLPSWLANRLIRRMTNLQFQDLGCSLKVFRAPVLKQVRLYGEMHRFIPAWLATVTSPERMAEEPVQHHAREHGASKYGLSRTFRVLVDLLAVHFFLNYGSRPGHFFGGVGLSITALGLAMLGYLGAVKLFLGEPIGGRPLLLLGFFCVLGGLQFLTTGVLAELLIRIYFEGDYARPYRTLASGAAPEADGAWHAP